MKLYSADILSGWHEAIEDAPAAERVEQLVTASIAGGMLIGAGGPRWDIVRDLFEVALRCDVSKDVAVKAIAHGIDVGRNMSYRRRVVSS